VQTHEEHDNSIVTRTTGEIALRPAGNEQGGYCFYSLTTGCHLNQNQWTPLPLPANVINREHSLARCANANRGLLFTDPYSNPLGTHDMDDDRSDSDNDSYCPDNESDDDESDDEVDEADTDDNQEQFPIAGVNDENNKNEQVQNNINNDKQV
jgi:hypothetical protein